MPRKKKPVETIKIEGLSSETVKEFEPKDNPEKDDALWESYFKGTPNLLKLPTKKDEQLNSTKGKEQLNDVVRIGTPVFTPVVTGVNTGVGEPKDKRITKESKPREEYVSLDATHTAMEAKVYSVIYRETVVKGNLPQHFGASRLMSLTGIGSDKTIRKAIKSLIAKKSIALIDPCPNHPLGAVYIAFPPKEIFTARKKAGMRIHPQTKKIITLDKLTDTNTGVRTGVGTPVLTQVKNTPVSPVETTPVTPVKGTGVPQTTPYINKNYINNDDSIKSIESSLKSSSIEDDTDDSTFNHRVHIISLYEKYTGNQWRVGDDEFYENQNLKNIIPDIIEAAIVASVLRSKTKINSFTYCEGVILEFQENLPSGYLSYLRAKWKDMMGKNRGGQGEIAVTKKEYERLKIEIGRIVNFIRQIRVGGDYETNLEDDVRANCKKENVTFDEEIYKEIFEESKHRRWKPE